MSASSSARPKTLNLVIDTANKKVLFAEATKAAVDLLCNLLALPVSTIIRLLGKDAFPAVGFLNLYTSVGNMCNDFVHPLANTDNLMTPSATFSSPEMMIFLAKALYDEPSPDVVIPLAGEDDNLGGLANKNMGYIFEDDLSLRPLTSITEYIKKFDLLNVEIKLVELSDEIVSNMDIIILF